MKCLEVSRPQPRTFCPQAFTNLSVLLAAAFAWSSGSGKPLLVTGTRAGAVDADFSAETKLELWDLNLDDNEQGVELQPIASISTDSR